MKPRGYGSILILACLIVLTIYPVSAAVSDMSSTVPLVAVGFPNVMQEKSKLQYNHVDFRDEGDRAAESGNYEDAVEYYNQAEMLVLTGSLGRTSDGTLELELAELESRKATAYASWGGHDAEAKQAQVKAQKMKAKADRKGSIQDFGCLIVTATFGSPMAAEVQLVRNFRDGSIKQSYTGSRFMSAFDAWYYSFSPEVSGYINEHPVVKPAMQVLITPILQIVIFTQFCYSFLSFSPELATIMAIIIGSTLYGLIYVFPATMAGAWVARRRGWDGGNLGIMKPVAAVWVSLIIFIIAGVTFSLDLLTTIASGLFVIVTIILVVGVLTMSLSHYIGRKDVQVPE